MDLIWERPIEIGHWVGFKDLTDLHNDWLKKFLFRDDDFAILAHRGSYKTTVLSLFFAIHMIIKPNETVMYFRKTDMLVAEIARQVANILSTGAVQNIVKILYGTDLKITKATASAVTTNLCTSVTGADQLIGLGISAAKTGRHADIVVVDDIADINDRISKAEREKTILNFMELQNIKNRGGRFIGTGTKWHPDDVYSEKYMPNIEIYDCYHTGLMSDADIEHVRSKMTKSLFSANYLLKIVSDEDALFKNPNILERTEDNLSLLYDGIAHIDAAYGGEDYTAYTIMHKLKDERIIAFGKLWQKHVNQCLPEVQHWHKLYKAGSIYCESNGDKGFLRDKLEDEYRFFVNDYHEHTNKYVKIATYLLQNWSNIYWVAETDPEYLEQICSYTENSSHDDAPDSAASLCRELEDEAYVNTDNILIGGII